MITFYWELMWDCLSQLLSESLVTMLAPLCKCRVLFPIPWWHWTVWKGKKWLCKQLSYLWLQHPVHLIHCRSIKHTEILREFLRPITSQQLRDPCWRGWSMLWIQVGPHWKQIPLVAIAHWKLCAEACQSLNKWNVNSFSRCYWCCIAWH